MKLITIEDYASWKNINLRDVYQLIDSGKLKSFSPQHSGLRRVLLVHVDNVPDDIVSLDANIDYISQKGAAHKMGIPISLLRKKINDGEIETIKMKNNCFIPVNKIER